MVKSVLVKTEDPLKAIHHKKARISPGLVG